jgi:regulator of protease activity HflC (stomatin/prohibitin superfamily)
VQNCGGDFPKIRRSKMYFGPWSMLLTILGFALFVFAFGIRIVRPIEKGLIERLGKYKRTAEQGFNWIIPIVDQMIKVNVTEQMVDIESQYIITEDNLNAIVDGVVYYKVNDVQKSEYNVDDHEYQLASLARTTLRAVIGKMSLADANEKRDEINRSVEEILDQETDSYGVDVLRVELQRIEPPEDVQYAMNEVVKASNEKRAAVDKATAVETEADGVRRAKIKEAQGEKEARILKAEGKAEAIKLENEAAEKYFKGNAQKLKGLETAENSLSSNTKYIIPSGSDIAKLVASAFNGTSD